MSTLIRNGDKISVSWSWSTDLRSIRRKVHAETMKIIFQTERIDVPETLDEEAWLEKQNFKNTAEDAYTGEIPKRKKVPQKIGTTE
ncbi:MAG: hypothetical protein Q4B26_09220 [Eubacteriales bacterium]|nr:hypothetical protein [Eubacteriales bacterium]